MQLGEVVFGGLGTGLASLVLVALVGVDDLVVVVFPTGLVLLRPSVMVDGEQHGPRLARRGKRLGMLRRGDCFGHPGAQRDRPDHDDRSR